MGRVIGVLVFIAVVALIIAGIRWATNRDSANGIRKKDLKDAQKRLREAEQLITSIQAVSLTNVDFQPHLAGSILTSINEYQAKRQRELEA